MLSCTRHTACGRGCLQLAPQSPVLQDAVSQMCCTVWLAKLEGRECVVAQTLPHLVIRALTTGASQLSHANSHGQQHTQSTVPSRCMFSSVPALPTSPLLQV